MAVLTDYLADALVRHTLRNVAYTSPTTVYLALFTTPTTAAGGGTEVSGGSYARQAIAFSNGASPGLVTQTSALTFTNMPACTVSHMAIMDAVTGGNMLIFGALRVARTVVATADFPLITGDIQVLFD